MKMSSVAHLTVVGLVALAACGDDTDEGVRPRDYIRADDFRKLVLEVDYVDGYAPASPPERIIAQLTAILDKPDGIELTLDDTLTSASGQAWSVEALTDLMDEVYDLPVDEATIKIHTIVVDGHYEQDTADGKVLGLSWGGRRVALFGETIRTLCQGSLPAIRTLACNATLNSVWMHEIGHLLGLVDNGLPMVTDHLDPDASHGKHDASPDCLMHWETNTGKVIQRVVAAIQAGHGESPLAFDAACQSDIAALRERTP